MANKTKRVPFDIEKAKQGAKIVTRSGLSARRVDVDDINNGHPVLCLVTWEDGLETPLLYSIDGRYYPNQIDDVRDLFIEEEVEEEHNNFEIMPDKWYLCTRGACLWLKNDINYITFEEGVPYPGADILKCDLSFEQEYYQKYFKPWNICYAKPGDVLASKNGTNILIFKQIESITSFSSYYNIQHRRDDCWANDCFIPATKEQYSQIFKKMKEDGYEWDSERNELKEIAADKAEEEVKIRRMTNRELAWWLRKCPEECREYKYKGCSNIHNTYNYYEDEADNPCLDDVLIRSNGGEWKEPLV